MERGQAILTPKLSDAEPHKVLLGQGNKPGDSKLPSKLEDIGVAFTKKADAAVVEWTPITASIAHFF